MNLNKYPLSRIVPMREKIKEMQENRMISNRRRSPDDELNSHMVGNLLGDGSLHKRGLNNNSSFHVIQTTKEYVFSKYVFISNYFASNFREYTRKNYLSNNYRTYALNTGCDTYFTYLRELWYLDGKRHIPYEFTERYFSESSLATWYFDDGTLNKGKPSLRRIEFATHAFAKQECEFLSELLLSKFDIISIVHPTYTNPKKEYFRIIVCGINAMKLIDLVKPFATPDMYYKLNIPHYVECVGDDAIRRAERVFDMHNKGMTTVEISKLFKVTDSRICQIIKKAKQEAK